MLNALEEFGTLPVSGGYLSQPVTIIRDMQAARLILQEQRRRAMQEAIEIRKVMQNAMAQTSLPDVPLPPIPKELLGAG